MPEIENEETQEEFGWEGMSANDDGTRDMGDVLPPKAEDPEPTPEPPAETALEGEGKPESAEPTAPEAAEQVAGAEATEAETQPEPITYTLPGGKKVTREELIANDKMLQDLVTHSNQLTHFQKLSEDRNAALQRAEAEKRQILDQYTQQQMQQQAAQQQQQQAPAYVRPPGKAIEAHFEPVLQGMIEDGRLTEDHKSEFGGLIAEHLFDMAQMRDLVSAVVQAGSTELDGIRQTIQGDIYPNVDAFRAQAIRQTEAQVQQTAAAKPGYEALADPQEWQRLTAFVAQKISNSGVDQYGNPIFNPDLDPDTAAQMYDAMTGHDLRAQLAAQAAGVAARAANQQVTAAVSGAGAARAGGAPMRQPSTKTPHDEAMDFSDPTMATG